MTQSYIRIREGEYAGNAVRNVVLPLVEQFKTGTKGGYVTVNGAYYKKDRNVRVLVTGPNMYDFVTEAEYLAQSSDLSPVTGAFAEVSTETDEEVMTRIGERFEILHEMTRAATTGDIRAMIVSGPPGVGKSFGVEQEVERACLFDQVANKKLRAEVIKGAVTPVALYCTLFKYSDPNSLLVFDDCDSVFFDDTSLNLLKAALDSGKKRKISWLADSRTLRSEGVPETFNFHGSIVFITNLKFDNVKSNKLKDHLEALQSRCHYLDLTLDTMRDKYLRIKQIAKTGELFSDYDFGDVGQAELLEFMYDNRNSLREMSLRMAIKIADLKKSFPLKWRALASTTCMKAV